MSIARVMSSMQTQQPGSLPDYRIDPYQLLEDDLKDVYEDIRRVFKYFGTFFNKGVNRGFVSCFRNLIITKD
jgi:hypothetical protein